MLDSSLTENTRFSIKNEYSFSSPIGLPMTSATTHQNRWKILAVLSLSLVIIGLDNTVMNVALPSIQEELDVSGSTLQWIVDAYMLVFAGLLLAAGNLGDRHGRKRALQSGLLIFGLASVGGA